MTTQEDYEFLLELDTIHSDMRLLGFSESAIHKFDNLFASNWNGLVEYRNMIFRYKQQSDLMGDAEE